MQDDNRENKTKVKERPLSSYEKDDIFIVRWITQIFIGMILCFILLKDFENTIWVIIPFIQAFIYPIIYWRNIMKSLCLKYWNLLRGRRA